MPVLRYTLVADGPSDRALLPIINWALAEQLSVAERSFIEQLADFRSLPEPPKRLASRIREATRLYPCDLLFVHRDSEKATLAERVAEIEQGAATIMTDSLVPVVPVRMTEAWLLVDEEAIRYAADNPNGRVPLKLPPPRRLERLAQPKRTLIQALITASEKTGRRRVQFERDLPSRVGRVAARIADFSVLRQLEAFRHFEDRLGVAVEKLV